MGFMMTEEEVAQLLVGLRHRILQHVESLSSSANTKNRKKGRCSWESDSDPYGGEFFQRNWSSKRRRNVPPAAIVSDSDFLSLWNHKSLHQTRVHGLESERESTERINGADRHNGFEIPSFEGPWYETPTLNEIARLSQIQGQQIETPPPLRPSILDISSDASSAELKHRMSIITPSSIVGVKLIPPSVGKLAKTLPSFTRQAAEESEFLTPQKKLLNSIDTVEKVVKEELQKLKGTPSAKKAHREKRVCTLMSMR